MENLVEVKPVIMDQTLQGLQIRQYSHGANRGLVAGYPARLLSPLLRLSHGPRLARPRKGPDHGQECPQPEINSRLVRNRSRKFVSGQEKPADQQRENSDAPEKEQRPEPASHGEQHQ